jgi:hypothetical protein
MLSQAIFTFIFCAVINSRIKIAKIAIPSRPHFLFVSWSLLKPNSGRALDSVPHSLPLSAWLLFPRPLFLHRRIGETCQGGPLSAIVVRPGENFRMCLLSRRAGGAPFSRGPMVSRLLFRVWLTWGRFDFLAGRSARGPPAFRDDRRDVLRVLDAEFECMHSISCCVRRYPVIHQITFFMPPIVLETAMTRGRCKDWQNPVDRRQISARLDKIGQFIHSSVRIKSIMVEIRWNWSQIREK